MRELIKDIISAIKYHLHICQQEGCWRREATPCHLPEENMQPGQGKPDYYYCWEHAHRQGFCHICGEFWGGIESFDLRSSGLCDHCEDQIHDMFDDYNDDEMDTYGRDDDYYEDPYRGE